MVAEKDAELAHTYKLLETSAAERSRLRLEHQAAKERMRDLQVCVCVCALRAVVDAGVLCLPFRVCL